MDYVDHAAGITGDYFWFKAKLVLLEQLLRRSGFKRGGVILSLGAGTGDELSVLNSWGRVWVLDINAQALGEVRIGAAKSPEMLLKGDAQRLPLADESVDLVVALDVLEHLQDDVLATAELHRVLKPGGRALITVPAFSSLFSGHDRALGHFRRYNRKSLQRLFHRWRRRELGFWVFTTFLPFVVSRFLKRRREGVDYVRVGPLLNSLLFQALAGEARLIGRGVSPPWGSTVYAVFQKTRRKET